MIKPFNLIQTLAQWSNRCNFSKILKLTPIKPNQDQINSPQMVKSITCATELFAKICHIPLPKTQNTFLTEKQTFEQFISLVADLSINAFEKSIMAGTNAQQMDEIIKKLNDQNILNNTIQLMIAQPQYTQRLKKFLTNFFNCACLLMRKKILTFQGKDLDLRFAKKYLNFFNEYMILIDLSDKLVVNYFLFMSYMKSTNSLDATRTFFVNQKIIIDYILERKNKFQLNKKDISILLGYLSSTSVVINYPAKYYPLLELIYSKIDSRWYTDPDYNIKKIIIQFQKMKYDCEKVTNGMRFLMNREITLEKFGVVLSSLNELIKIKANLYYGKPVPDEYLLPLKRISAFLRKYKQSKEDKQKVVFTKNLHENWIQEMPKHLIPTLYRSSIWLEQIWFDFADWLQTEQNYKKMKIINLYTIFQLLEIDKDIIPKAILERLEKSKQFLLMKHNFRIQDVDLIKEYHREFGDRMRPFHSMQQQISNNLRSVSKKKITAEALIRMFIVDILVNDNIIIEINSQTHYIEHENKGQKKPNLKSAFRKRVMEKLGYKFIEYDVDNFVDGNIEFLTVINKEIDRVSA